jgi:hypothetical protein
MKFKNPQNGHIEEASGLAWLWVLLFGCFYFMFKGIWIHAIISFVVAIITVGLSWLVYPFFANSIVTKHYLNNGWIPVGADGEELSVPGPGSK